MDNIVKNIAKYADIDTRRALGVFSRLPKSDLKIGPPRVLRYWPLEKRAIVYNFLDGNFEFEVHQGLLFEYDQDYMNNIRWFYTDEGSISTVWQNRHGKYDIVCRNTIQNYSFDFGGPVEFLSH
jgi:hypothetical protein